MKSSLFSTIFKNILLEDMYSGDGGSFGAAQEPIFSPDNIVSRDSYAKGDARNIFGNAKFKIQRRGKAPNIIIGKRRKKRKKRS